ncbi:hypothetical protein Cgig2_002267 [Carnegiea gigantea]|uniref:Uncharacterized protein n=1 Tax=Carnegiea gigantea TaxID=171969 RepID=A0A9Q1KUU0_9CARY|nr:hypothetical protein Cgig2_002267 [Carnegiea gigantea]
MRLIAFQDGVESATDKVSDELTIHRNKLSNSLTLLNDFLKWAQRRIRLCVSAHDGIPPYLEPLSSDFSGKLDWEMGSGKWEGAGKNVKCKRVSNIIDDVLEWSPKLALSGMMKQQSDVANVTDFHNESASAGDEPSSEEIPPPPGDINMDIGNDQPEDETPEDGQDNSRHSQQNRADL